MYEDYEGVSFILGTVFGIVLTFAYSALNIVFSHLKIQNRPPPSEDPTPNYYLEPPLYPGDGGSFPKEDTKPL